ncbi:MULTISPECIES: hypothetical protein [Paenibacillus]|uniref:hypothetical protein n=1 Tax=Paenibacillus TaxID=44249 RepID=UPI001F30E02B|nr:hypothetical protein [Paenibacillus sp. JJ-223]
MSGKRGLPGSVCRVAYTRIASRFSLDQESCGGRHVPERRSIDVFANSGDIRWEVWRA